MNTEPAKKLTEFVTVRLDDDDLRDLAMLRRERELRDNGRQATHSLVVRDLIRGAAARARETPLGAATESSPRVPDLRRPPVSR